MSSKQAIVALSTAEAEYVSATHTVKAIMWIRMFLSSVARPLSLPSVLNVDNQSTIHLLKDSRFHARTKHIAVRYHFIREAVENQEVRVQYCPTDDMTADILTKGLKGPRVVKLAGLLGLERST